MFQGNHVAVAFRQRWEDRNMAEMIPEFLRAPALEAASFCVEEQRAVYMIYTALDAEGQRIDCERLLLPFGSAEGGVRQLLASMEVVGLMRNVPLSEAVTHFARSYEIAFAGCFAPLPVGHGSLHASRTGDVEIAAV